MHNPEARSSRELVPEPNRETFSRGEKPLARISHRINVYFDISQDNASRVRATVDKRK